MKRKPIRTTALLVVACLLGLCLMLYPTVSNYVNEKSATRAISTYVEKAKAIDETEAKKAWEDAVAYNKDILVRGDSFLFSDEGAMRYEKTLDLFGDGLMGYIEIPSLDVALPIYHGTSDEVLQHSIGHVSWSSLPVGGPGTHTVLSGHRGLPSAKLFTDLDELRVGDVFTLNVLNTTLTYEVDQIRTVKPDIVDSLLIEEGIDYCTLVTCTPYGINTHRLLVRGHRIENSSNVEVTSEAVKINPMLVASVIALSILLALLLVAMISKPDRAKSQRVVISPQDLLISEDKHRR